MDKQQLLDLSSLILEKFEFIISPTRQVWKSSKFFRIISIVTGSITVFSVARGVYIRIYKKYYRIPPGPIGLPYVGHLYEFGTFDSVFFKSLPGKYPHMASFFLGPFMSVVINDPKIARKVYANDRLLDRAPFISFGNSFGFSNGKSWRERRRMIYANLMSTMKSSYVEDKTKSFIKNKVFPVFDENISNNKLTSTKQLFRPMGPNIVLQACFGKELSSLQDEFWLNWDDAMTKLNNTVSNNIMIMVLCGGDNIISRFIGNLFIGGSLGRQTENLIDILERFNKDVSNNIISDDDMKSDKHKDVKLFKDYMNDYLNNEDGSKYTERELLGDMMNVMLAATDTTYSALAFALVLVCKYPEIQEELHEELINAYGDNVDNIELQKGGIRKIPKLRAFIHEVIRISAPVPSVGIRWTTDEGFIVDVDENTSYTIPKDTMVAINAMGISEDPRHWIKDYDSTKDGDINMNEIHFDFWLDKNGQFVKQKNSCSFLNFHIGKRDCVGQTLAMKEIIIVLAMIFMKYRVSTKDGISHFEIESYFGGAVNEPKIQSLRFEHRNIDL